MSSVSSTTSDVASGATSCARCAPCWHHSLGLTYLATSNERRLVANQEYPGHGDQIAAHIHSTRHSHDHLLPTLGDGSAMLMSGEKVRLRLATPDFPQMVTWGRRSGESLPRATFQPPLRNVTLATENRSDRHAQHYAIVSCTITSLSVISARPHYVAGGDGELRIRIGEHHLWDQGYGTDAIVTFLRRVWKHDSLLHLRVFASNLLIAVAGRLP